MRTTEQQREYMRGYYLRNRDAIRVRVNLRKEANRDAINAERRASYKLAPRKKTVRGESAQAMDKINREARIAREPLYYVLSCAKTRARRKGLEFSITSADVPIPEFCPVLGIPLKKGIGKTNPCSPSIDRIDSSRGYVPGNVWVISYLANARKNDQSAKEILEFGVRLRLALAARGYVENNA